MVPLQSYHNGPQPCSNPLGLPSARVVGPRGHRPFSGPSYIEFIGTIYKTVGFDNSRHTPNPEPYQHRTRVSEIHMQN